MSSRRSLPPDPVEAFAIQTVKHYATSIDYDDVRDYLEHVMFEDEIQIMNVDEFVAEVTRKIEDVKVIVKFNG